MQPELSGCQADQHEVSSEIKSASSANPALLADFSLLLIHKDIACNKLVEPPPAIKVPRISRQKASPKAMQQQADDESELQMIDLSDQNEQNEEQGDIN